MSKREPTSNNVLPRLVGAKKAAIELGIPYSTLRDMTFRGLIPVIKLGRAWYFDRRDLIDFIEQQKREE